MCVLIKAIENKIGREVPLDKCICNKPQRLWVFSIHKGCKSWDYSVDLEKDIWEAISVCHRDWIVLTHKRDFKAIQADNLLFWRYFRYFSIKRYMENLRASTEGAENLNSILALERELKKLMSTQLDIMLNNIPWEKS